SASRSVIGVFGGEGGGEVAASIRRIVIEHLLRDESSQLPVVGVARGGGDGFQFKERAVPGIRTGLRADLLHDLLKGGARLAELLFAQENFAVEHGGVRKRVQRGDGKMLHLAFGEGEFGTRFLDVAESQLGATCKGVSGEAA